MNRMRPSVSKIVFFCSLLFLGILASSSAQTLPFKYYSVSDGLLSGNVTTLFQDSRGYLWIGTVEGLSKYDGTAFQNYTQELGLENTYITSISESRKKPGTIYVGTIRSGYAILRDDKITPAHIGKSSDLERVLAFCEDRRGMMWISTGAGIFQLRDTVPTQFHPEIRLPEISDIVEVGDSVLILVADKTLYSYSFLSDSVREIPLSLESSDGIIAISTDGDGFVWIGTNQGNLYQLAGTVIIHNYELRVPLTKFIVDDRHGYFWAGTMNGILRFPKANISSETITRFTSEHGLRSGIIGPAIIDHEDNLWLSQSGLLKLRTMNILKFHHEEMHIIYNNAIAGRDVQGHLWLPENNGVVEVAMDNVGNWNEMLHHIYKNDSLKYGRSTVIDAKGNLWIHTSNGAILCYSVSHIPNNPSDVKLIRTLTPGVDFPDKSVTCFLIDRNGDPWISLSDGGLVICRNNGQRFYTMREGLQENAILALFEDREGNIWAGGYSRGLAKLSLKDSIEGRWQLFTKVDGLPNDAIRAITQDQDGRIWIGTRYGGIAVFENGTFQTISMKDGLISNSVWALSIDSKGRVWFATSRGLGYIENIPLRSIHIVPELTGSELRACGQLSEGVMWTVSYPDLIIYDSRQERKNVTPPPIHITQFQVNGRERTTLEPIELSYDENHCVIEYVGVCLSDERKVLYQYMMEGIEKSWQPPTSRRAVTYGALKPGSFTFMVKAINNDGVSSMQPAMMKFVILPPYWQTAWFEVAVTLVFVIAGFTAYQLRVAHFKKEKKAQEEFSRKLIESQEKERKRIAGELHDSLGQNLLIIKNGIQQCATNLSHNQNVAEDLDQISDVTLQAINEVREISYDLHPHTLERLGLKKGIQSVVSRFSQTSNVKFNADIDEIDKCFPKDLEINIFRLVQEGINNIVKHSDATTGELSIQRKESILEIAIRDNGKGFDVEQYYASPSTRHGFGLTGMIERVKLLQGKMNVKSSPGNGTLLLIQIPLNTDLS